MVGFTYCLVYKEKEESFTSRTDFGCSSSECGAAVGPAEVTVAVEGFSQARLQDLHQMLHARYLLLRTLYIYIYIFPPHT